MNTQRLFVGTVAAILASYCCSQAMSLEANTNASWNNRPDKTVAGAAAPTEKLATLAPDNSCDCPCTPCPDVCGCCNMCPCTYGEVEWLFLKRDSGNPNRTILVNETTQATLVSSSDLDFDFNSGVRALVGFHIWGCVPIEFGYFGLFDQVASLQYLPQQGVNATLPGPLGVASNVFHDSVTVNVDYRSRLQGAEVNFPCCCCCEDPCSNIATSREWFLGFRYISLREDLLIFGEKPVGRLIETGYYDANSRNDLYGGQFGLRLRRCRGQFSWEGTAKAGIFYNQAGQEQVFVDYPNFFLRAPVSGSRDAVAFASELNLTGIYQINETWGLRAGYNAMWIQGVATAPNQLDFSFASTSGTGVGTNGGLFLHGVNVGLEARW